MAEKYQKLFKLDRADLDVVEHALREQVKSLSMAIIGSSSKASTSGEACDTRSQVHEIHDLLGRLHDQKVWFRPKHYVPRG